MYMSCGHCLICCFFFFKQKTAYEMRISDWSSDVCSSDLDDGADGGGDVGLCVHVQFLSFGSIQALGSARASAALIMVSAFRSSALRGGVSVSCAEMRAKRMAGAASTIRRTSSTSAKPSPHTCRSEEHTSELQSLMRISYAVFCLKKTKQ